MDSRKIEITEDTRDTRPDESLMAGLDPLPASRRIYVEGSRPDIQVPMREITLEDSSLPEGKTEKNPPIFVYDTAGDFGDPAKKVDITKGSPGASREVDRGTSGHRGAPRSHEPVRRRA